MAEKRAVFAIRLEGNAVGEGTIASVLNLIYLAFIINFSACLILTASGLDLITAFSAVSAAMFNIGPGLGSVGPVDNYAHIPELSKWTLSFCMPLGVLYGSGCRHAHVLAQVRRFRGSVLTALSVCRYNHLLSPDRQFWP